VKIVSVSVNKDIALGKTKHGKTVIVCNYVLFNFEECYDNGFVIVDLSTS